MNHKEFYLIAILLLPILFTSCGEKKEESGAGLTITDDLGVEVKLNKLPKRIISMAPNITESLYAVGADSLLVGVTSFCDYPPDAKNKEVIGDLFYPDYEKIVSLKPDLVIMRVDAVSKPTYEAVKNLGLNIFVANAKDMDGIFKTLDDLGEITGLEERAGEIADSLMRLKEEFAAKVTNGNRKGFVSIATNPLMSVNGETFISDIMELGGIENLYKDEPMDYPTINYEDVIKKNPEYIIIPWDTTDRKGIDANLEEIRSNLNTTDAVKNGNVIIVDWGIMTRPGPRVLEGAAYIKGIVENN